MKVRDLDLLVCPDCHSKLDWRGTNVELTVDEGALVCRPCGVEWHVRDGWARFYRDRAVRRRDELIRRLCDAMPALHDPFVYVALPALQGGTARDLRRVAIRHLRLDELEPHADGSASRVLEVGIGTGAQLPGIYDAFPEGTEVWGTDLSVGLLALTRHRIIGDERMRHTRLVLSDAHHLPFPDGAFDRVLHVGGTGGFRDPAAAFAEMARVSQPGSPVVIVGEKLDPARRHRLLHRIVFRTVADPHDPVAALPAGATGVRSEQVSRYYCCLSFRS